MRWIILLSAVLVTSASCSDDSTTSVPNNTQDLAVVAVAVEGVVGPGRQVSLQYEYDNKGTEVAAAGYLIRIIISEEPSLEHAILLQESEGAALGPAATISSRSDIKVPMAITAEPVYFGVLVDPTNLGAEPIRDNNLMWSAGLGVQVPEIAYVRPGGGIALMYLDGIGTPPLHATGVGPRWSPDRNSLAFTSSGDLYVVGRDSAGLRQITANVSVRTPAWAPNGEQLVVASGRDLYVVGVDGSGLRQITNLGPEGASASSPDWSPDGNTIVFIRSTGTIASQRTYLVDPNGGNLRPAYEAVPTATYFAESSPRWSPNGVYIAYAKKAAYDPGSSVGVIPLDGSAGWFLHDVSVNASSPTWSPAGEQIAFYNGGDIAVSPFRGGQVTTIGPGTQPSWGH